ncbi:MAG: hypothetical protein ACRETD_02650, partial [Steroidobacteraceae bacterium]
RCVHVAILDADRYSVGRQTNAGGGGEFRVMRERPPGTATVGEHWRDRLPAARELSIRSGLR